jgi:hypothetical protein
LSRFICSLLTAALLPGRSLNIVMARGPLQPLRHCRRQHLKIDQHQSAHLRADGHCAARLRRKRKAAAGWGETSASVPAAVNL